MRHTPAALLAAAAMLVAAVPPAAARPDAGRSQLTRLSADTDEGILLAQAMKDWLVLDLGSQRVFQTVKYVIVQDWVREYGFEGLDAKKRRVYRDPSRYDAPIVQWIAVTMPKGADTPAEAVLTWDVPLHLWEELSRDVTALAADMGKYFAAQEGRPMRILLRFRDAEVLRLSAAPDGRAETIFSYR
ncbi:MAG TPA: hypothetical protein VF406_09365 [Thermodesulfobacteriota bacterium]